MPSRATLAQIEARVDLLLADLEVHIPEMINIQVELARTSQRCATRQRASAKIIDWVTEALAMKAKLNMPEHDEEVKDNSIKVLVVDQAELEMARARAAAAYQESVKQLKK